MKRVISRWTAVGLAVAALFWTVGPALANNVVVTNTALETASPVAAGTVKVKFDLSWDNSWRNGINYDACWVFVKYSTDSGTNWSHATLAGNGTNPTGFSAGSGTGLDIVVPSDRKGAFIQRSAVGAGTVSNTALKLVWDFQANGVAPSQKARVQVFAIEMAYIPSGSFYAGDGTAGTVEGQFCAGTSGSTPFLITNEAYAITLGGGGAGSMGNHNATGILSGEDFNDSTARTLPSAFPKGYAAFYLMKTEMSQRQYCDFLNTLPTQQQTNRVSAALHYGSQRNYIKRTSSSPAFFGCDANNNAGSATSATASSLNEANDGEWTACNYVSWMDVAAYADWAALRPMTELEFEKACRGTNAPVADEFVWGNTTMPAKPSSLNNAQTASETPNPGNCNVSGSTGGGPYRCGSFATASSTRQDAGAGYYGCLDLAGNLFEQVVTLGNSTGRGFAGTHGDGVLSANGRSNNADWPGWSGAEVTGSTGSGGRGGDFSDGNNNARTSDRQLINNTSANWPEIWGWHGVRTAP